MAPSRLFDDLATPPKSYRTCPLTPCKYFQQFLSMKPKSPAIHNHFLEPDRLGGLLRMKKKSKAFLLLTPPARPWGGRGGLGRGRWRGRVRVGCGWRGMGGRWHGEAGDGEGWEGEGWGSIMESFATIVGKGVGRVDGEIAIINFCEDSIKWKYQLLAFGKIP